MSQGQVRAGKGGGAKCCHHRHLIRGIVNRPETVEQVPDLLCVEEKRTALYAIGDSGILQAAREDAEACPRPNQYAYVTQRSLSDTFQTAVVYMQARVSS